MKKKQVIKKKEEHPIIKEKKHKARRRSIREGMFATAQMAFGGQFISPFAIALSLSNSLVAMLSSIGGILGPISQLFSSRLIEKYPRKKIVLKSVLMEAIIWIPMIIIAFLFSKDIITSLIPLFFVFFFAFRIIIMGIGGPAWFSWIGDLVDEEYRGRWFAKRNLIHGFIAIILALGASIFLDYSKGKGLIMIGFIVLFSLAMFSRLLSWGSMKGQYEPKLKMKKGYYFSFWDFLINAPKNNFGRFTIFRGFLTFSQFIAAPLIAIYLLRNLNMSYTMYMIIILAGSFSSIMLIGLWGKFADKYGNYKTLVITSFFIPTIPILWMLSTNPIYLITIPALVGGLSWAGFNLAAGNFIYDNVSNQRRGIIISYYNMVLGIGTFLGAGLGAILIKYINTTTIKPIMIIFLISGIARMLTVMIGIPKIKEVRKTTKFDGRQAFKNIILKEGRHTIGEEVHQIISIKDYLIDKKK